MIYGIWVSYRVLDVFEDGSKKEVTFNEGWLRDAEYISMKSAKVSLADAKEMLIENWCDVTAVNTVTLKGVRVQRYDGEPNAPVLREEHVVYHIKKR
jgi:hypothetical protein